MKGLIIKDCRLFAQQYRYFFFILAIVVFVAWQQKDASFSMSYMYVISSMVAMTTISYDKEGSGYTFLFTLPVTRREYVFGKYLFVLGVSSLFGLLSSLLGCWYNSSLQNGLPMTELLGTVYAYFLIGLMLQAFMIPIYLKFETKMIQTIVFVIIAGFFAGIILLSQLPVGQKLLGLIEKMDEIPLRQLALASLSVCLILYVLSILISLHVMEKKEF